MRDNLMQKPESAPPAGETRYELLDGLRGVAAAVVLFAHACGQSGANQYFEKKYLAVYFFFMLSGFVVACAYEKRMKAGMPVLQFYLRRAIRLYPMLVAGTVLCVGYLVTFDQRFVADPAKYVAIIFSVLGLPYQHAEFNKTAFPINPPEWSLFYELLAYLIYGLLAAHLRLWHLIVCGIVSLALFAFGAHYYYGHQMGLIAHTFTAAAPFTIGILLWRNHEAQWLKLPPLPFWLLATMVAAPCALPDSFDRGFDALIAATVFPIVIISGAAHGNRNSGPAMKALGDLSYPVYILHWPFILLAPMLLRGRTEPIVIALSGCVIAIFSAWLAFRYYDLPVRRYLNGSLRRIPQPFGSASVSSATSG